MQILNYWSESKYKKYPIFFILFYFDFVAELKWTQTSF